MKIQLKVTFKTLQPVSDEQGWAFWAYGNRFCAVPGKSTYQLTTDGESESLVDSVVALEAIIQDIVSSERNVFGSNTAAIVKVEAEVIDV